MKVLILGAGGMLGHKLLQVLGQTFDARATCRSVPDGLRRFDWFKERSLITSTDAAEITSFEQAIKTFEPDVVINAIGVIKQIPSAKDVINTLEINSIFPQRLARLAGEFGFRLIQMSTDCVFSGRTGYYSEADLPDAGDLYGQSKRWGEVVEENCLTLRTSIIGHEIGSHHSLVDWFLSNRGGKVKGFTKAIYSGFPTVVFANIIKDIITLHPQLQGLYHLSSEPINKFELISMINSQYRAEIEIEGCDDPEIDRSLNSDRFRTETGFQPQSWPDMIKAMHDDAKIYEN